jgi:hypothetical protein
VSRFGKRLNAVNVNLLENCICIALISRYSLKGLHRPYVDETPLTLAPMRARENNYY